MEYYFAEGNQQRGPHALEELSSFGLKPEMLVWRDGLPEWVPAGTLPELASLFSSVQQVMAVAPTVAPAATLVPGQVAIAAPPLAYQGVGSNSGNQNGMAIAALVLGIVALVTILCDGFGLIPGILAIIFGVLSRKQIRRTDAQGYGMATAGLVCGSIAVGLVVLIAIGIIIAIAVSRLR
jgi:hypothetical protein